MKHPGAPKYSWCARFLILFEFIIFKKNNTEPEARAARISLKTHFICFYQLLVFLQKQKGIKKK